MFSKKTRLNFTFYVCAYMEKIEKNQKRKPIAILIAMTLAQFYNCQFFLCPEISILTVVLLRKAF